jgi:hypothetical protein
LHDVGRHEDIDFLVMEYLDGETLEDRIRGPEGLRLLREGSGRPSPDALRIVVTTNWASSIPAASR